MNKKKILVLAMSFAMVAILAIGGTIAYFTDTDEETNEFTIGNVQIDLEENFDPENNILRPGTQTQNKLTKEVWIENVGSEDAYVWYEWYIPTALDTIDGTTGKNNVLHVNSYGKTWDKYWQDSKYTLPEGYTVPTSEDMTWDHDPEKELGIAVGPEGYFEQVEIEGVKYNKYVVLYHGIVEAEEGETTIAMNGVYLDSRVDFDGTDYTFEGQKIDFDFTQGIDIIVKAYGIQSEGFDTVYDAYKAYQAQQ